MERIIFRYLNDNLTAEEWDKLKIWLNASPENRATFNKLSSYVSNVDKERDLVRLEIWDDLKERIAEHEASDSVLYMQPRKAGLSQWIKIAAVLVLTAAASLIALNITKTQDDVSAKPVAMVKEFTQAGQKKRMVLPDGSTVVLNAQSRIELPSTFAADKREVILHGEAFFDVARDESKPFIIHSGDLQVEVLGTSFNVKSYEEDQLQSVSVSSGKVKVSNQNDSEYLIPGEKATLSKGAQQLDKSSFDQDREFGWMTNRLVFQGENLDEVLSTLSRQYGIDFFYSKDAFNQTKRFSGRFEDAPLSEVLNGLAYVYDFNFKIKRNAVEIKKTNQK